MPIEPSALDANEIIERFQRGLKRPRLGAIRAAKGILSAAGSV